MTMTLRALLICAIYLFALPLAFAQNDQNEADYELQGAPTPAQAPASAKATPAQATPAGIPAHANLQPAGQMVWVSGGVKASYPDQQPRILSRGAVVYEKDVITTDASGSGQIAFTDNSMVTLKEGTNFVIEQYYFNQQKPTEGGQSVMNLVKGGFRTVTGFIGKSAPANYQIKTPVATIGVRGTDFQTSCPRVPGQCAFALLHGLIVLENSTGTYILNQETPYASINSSTTAAVLSRTPPGILGTVPTIAPPNAPPPAAGGGNCGILIN